MKIFVSEFLTSGACPDIEASSSLLTEGRAMFTALAADLHALPDVQVRTTWDRRLPLPEIDGLECEVVADGAAEADSFARQVAASDLTLIIAPETGGCLAERIETAERLVGSDRVLNCAPSIVRLTTDKLALAEWAAGHGLATIPTCLLDDVPAAPSWDLPLVVKPRDGAGCEATFLVRSADEWQIVAELATACIVQPWIDGVPLSSAAVFDRRGTLRRWLPLGRQFIESGSEMRYGGGEIPWIDPDAAAAEREAREQTERLAELLTAEFGGLCGYVGCDWIWRPAERRLVLVEINPRLTTAYVGYRRLFAASVWECLLGDANDGAERSQRIAAEDRVRFAPTGEVRIVSDPVEEGVT